jgi:hypothetical protein
MSARAGSSAPSARAWTSRLPNAAAAAELLLAEGRAGEHEHGHVMFQPELIARGSTGAPGRRTLGPPVGL